MKRIALAGLLVAWLSGPVVAQSVFRSGSDEPTGSGFQPVILKGVNSESELKPVAAMLPTHLQAPVDATDDTAGLATCDQCHHEWTDCCCDHGWTFFGQWLLLQPRGADAVFAVRSTNCTAPPLGSAEQLDFGSFSGFKVGLGKLLCDGCSQIEGSFTHFESNESAHTLAATGVLRPLLTHPGLVSCDNLTSTSAAASGSIDFERVDLDYRRFIECGCVQFDWLVGFAYGQLTQDLNASFDTGSVRVESGAWGYGARIGGGAEYGHGCIRGYGHLDLTLLASNAQASFKQNDTFTGEVARFSQDLDRIIPILDLELGLAVDVCKHVVLKAGYTYSFWFNVVTTPDFVEAVQRGRITGDVDDTLTFDGPFARVEITW